MGHGSDATVEGDGYDGEVRATAEPRFLEEVVETFAVGGGGGGVAAAAVLAAAAAVVGKIRRRGPSWLCLLYIACLLLGDDAA